MNLGKMNLFNLKTIALILLLLACNQQEDVVNLPIAIEERDSVAKISYLALGDSYTIGESVPNNKSFPKQLEKRLEDDLNIKVQTKIIAQTGWRTDNLLDAIATADLESSYDFVTLLIGVNNQFQGVNFVKYEEEFPELLATAIKFAGNNPSRVVIVSIPDWSFTPFGKNRDGENIASEIDTYNAFAKLKAEASEVQFIEITDITREGLAKPELVAGDGLHPSAVAYKLFVDRIAPKISSGLKD